MRRRVYAVPAVCFVVAGVLVVLALLSRPAEAPRLAIEVGAARQIGAVRTWPIDVRLGGADSGIDLLMAIRFHGDDQVADTAELAFCLDPGCGTLAPHLNVTRPRGTVSTGRVGTIEPGQTVHLRLALAGARSRSATFDVNASPCAAAPQGQLWRVRETVVGGRPNTVAGIENCATRSVPYLPAALEVAGVGAAAVVASRRFAP